MNLFNRDTGIDSAVGIAGHPYMYIWQTYGYAYWSNLHEMAAEQGDNSCTGHPARV